MIRRTHGRNTVKAAQIAQMHRAIDATLPTGPPDITGPRCPICSGRCAEGEGMAEDRAEYLSSWQTLVYCSQACYDLRPIWRA